MNIISPIAMIGAFLCLIAVFTGDQIFFMVSVPLFLFIIYFYIIKLLKYYKLIK